MFQILQSEKFQTVEHVVGVGFTIADYISDPVNGVLLILEGKIPNL